MSNQFGDVFSDQIVKTHGRQKSPVNSLNENSSDFSMRIWVFVILLVFGLGILIARLFTLTVIQGREYRALSEGNRIRERKIAAPRGIIYDRNGEPLVRNIPVFKLDSGKEYFESIPATLSANTVESIDRDYIYKDVFAHAIGFTSEVTAQDLSINKNSTTLYSLGDKIGKMGIEQFYDQLLRGKNGKELEEVDAVGNRIRLLGRLDPMAGQNINLSLDLNLQQIAYEQLKDKKGAVVVENPRTGEVMALFSSPSFDPNSFIRGQDLDKIFADTNQPLFDRAVSGLYPPGSTFKIITSLAALESRTINAETQYEDTGILTVGSFSFGNWYFLQYGRKEGMVDIVKAIKRSNDIFFYKAGEATGIEKISEWAKKAGIGKTLGIDIAGEAAGLMPDPLWQKETKGEIWYLGNTYHVAIGQGDILTTPLQVNAWTNVIANGGKLCRPHLLRGQKEECKDLKIKKENIDLIREGMKEACATGGTAYPLFNFKVTRSVIPRSEATRDPLRIQNFVGSSSADLRRDQNDISIDVACKTGTAEFGDPKNRTHAWLTAFAPVVNPQISVTVLVEGGGEGSTVGAPIARKILEKWFEK